MTMMIVRLQDLFFNYYINLILDSLDTGFTIKDARLLKYQKSIFHIVLPSLLSLSRSGIFLFFESRGIYGKPLYVHTGCARIFAQLAHLLS